MPLPNFILFGAAKSGTTALYNYLKQHPQIYMSPIKEPCFFSLGEGYDLKDVLQPVLRDAVLDFENYQALFKEAQPHHLAIGEATPEYILFPRAAERIKHYLPNVKLIAILRHPAERAFSAYIHQFSGGNEPINNFYDALQAEPERLGKRGYPNLFYRHNGLYAQHLKKYFEMFDRTQIQINLYDDLINDPIALFKKIFVYLGINSEIPIDISTKHNITYLSKNLKLSGLLNSENGIRAKLRNFIPFGWREPIKSRLNKMNRTRPTLDPQLRADLTEYYREDILQLQDLIRRDLSHWLA